MYLKNYSQLFIIFSYLFLITVVNGDSNGVWHNSKDIRGGIFGDDEQNETISYNFINPVFFNESLNANLIKSSAYYLNGQNLDDRYQQEIFSTSCPNGISSIEDDGVINCVLSSNLWETASYNSNLIKPKDFTAKKIAVNYLSVGTSLIMGSYNGIIPNFFFRGPGIITGDLIVNGKKLVASNVIYRTSGVAGVACSSNPSKMIFYELVLKDLGSKYKLSAKMSYIKGYGLNSFEEITLNKNSNGQWKNFDGRTSVLNLDSFVFGLIPNSVNPKILIYSGGFTCLDHNYNTHGCHKNNGFISGYLGDIQRNCWFNIN